MIVAMIIIGAENTLIEKYFPTVSPIFTLAIYGLTMLLMSGAAYPFRDKLGMEWSQSPMPALPWIIFGAALFWFGSAAYFTAYARGGTKEQVITAIALLPVVVTVMSAVIEKKMPSAYAIGAALIVVIAMLLIKLDLAAQAKIPAESAANPPG